jgi:hypothetical protein
LRTRHTLITFLLLCSSDLYSLWYLQGDFHYFALLLLFLIFICRIVLFILVYFYILLLLMLILLSGHFSHTLSSRSRFNINFSKNYYLTYFYSLNYACLDLRWVCQNNGMWHYHFVKSCVFSFNKNYSVTLSRDFVKLAVILMSYPNSDLAQLSCQLKRIFFFYLFIKILQNLLGLGLQFNKQKIIIIKKDYES